MNNMSAENVEVLVCDLHTRTTGVSTTIRSQLPILQQKVILAFVAKNDDPSCKKTSLLNALKICKSTLPSGKPFRIWHARRNNEMVWGLIFKYVFRCKIQLVFTSAAKRRHSWFPRQLIHAMDHIVATTKQAAEYVPNVRAVIGHGVDQTRFVPQKDKQALKLKLNIEANINVAIVGRIRPEKGTDTFVKAMIEVFKKNENVDAYLFGFIAKKHQKFASELKESILKAGLSHRFFWKGGVDIQDMPTFQSLMDITVAPARYEGYGMVPLEAMACENVVLATDTGAYSLMIEQGKTGFIIDNEKDLVEKMSWLLDRPDCLKQMGGNAHARVLQKFTLIHEVTQIVNVYEQCWEK